nr:transposase [Actinomyces sp. ICM47]
MLDAFHIVKLAGDALDEVHRRVQQDTLGHRGRKGDPLYQIRLLLHALRAHAHPTSTRTTPRGLHGR